jgi:hypothetical protein
MEDIPRTDAVPPKKRTVNSKPSLPGHRDGHHSSHSHSHHGSHGRHHSSHGHEHDSNNNTPNGTPTNSGHNSSSLSPLLDEQRITIHMDRPRRTSTVAIIQSNDQSLL